MGFKTKIEKGILYKDDYKLLNEEYRERIEKSVKSSTVYKLKWNDLTDLKAIYQKYYPKDFSMNLNCGKCLMRMLTKLQGMIRTYENQ